MAAKFGRRALISVSDKSGLDEFTRGLVDFGFEILSTGGTAKFLTGHGIPVTDVAAYTGFPEMMDGRVKTLHPRIHGGILGRPTLASDVVSMQEHGITPIELVVCNLYPFEQTIAREGVSAEEAIEQIDIGGPSMVRSASKNHEHVAIVTSPTQYARVLDALQQGSLPLSLRRELAGAAFQMTARYDAAIAAWFESQRHEAAGASAAAAAIQFSDVLRLEFRRAETLRYGENPHQAAAIYHEPQPAPASLAAARQLHGKELSYNNLLDLDAALAIVREFTGPACAVIKHNNPCGCGTAETLADAFQRGYDGDPVSAFGSILGMNRAVDLATAEKLCEPNRFIEAIIAPAYDPDALQLLTTRPKWKSSVRLLALPGFLEPRQAVPEYRSISGGLLVQERDDRDDSPENWTVVTRRAPRADERRELEFAWKVCKHVKSNAIVLSHRGMVVGVGAGQMSRLDSAQIAVTKSAGRARGGVAASDAFFPFRDGLDTVAAAGVTAVIQPGGSKGDPEVIAAADEHGLAMLFTSQRHFRH